MPFTTDSAVRARFQMDDTELVPPAMVAAAIDTAHLEITRHLVPGVETDPPEEGLVLGETVLAGARVYELLAGADAVAARRLRLGSVTAHEGERRLALLAVAVTYRSALPAGKQDKYRWFNAGTRALQEDDLGSAIERLQTAVEIDPNFASAWKNLGIALERAGRRRESENALLEAFRLEPQMFSSEVREQLVRIKEARGAESR